MASRTIVHCVALIALGAPMLSLPIPASAQGAAATPATIDPQPRPPRRYVQIAPGWLGDQLASERDVAEAERIIATNFVSVVALLVPLGNHFEAAGAGHIAVLSSVAGIIISYHADLPSGPAVILSAGLIYLLSLAFGRQGGVLRRYVRRAHLEH